MEENKDLVTEVTENVEQTTEQTPVKMYTQEEVDAIAGKVKARAKASTEARVRKEYDRMYGPLVDTLKAGTGKDSVEEVTATFADFYKSKGIKLPEQPTYNAHDVEVLARADANEFINAGFDDVVEEVDRLAAVGAANMTPREKAMFKVLAEHRQSAERGRELTKIGVTEDVYGSKEFTEFAAKFNANTPITDVYNIYTATRPKKDIKPMGSMKNSASDDKGVKEFYTRDEALKFTVEDLRKTPGLQQAIENSMLKW